MRQDGAVTRPYATPRWHDIIPAMDLSGAHVAVIGRLSAAPRARIADAMRGHGAVLTHGLAKAHGLVVGHHAHRHLPPVLAALATADRQGLWCLSERRLLRALGLAPPLPSLPRALSLEDLGRHSGLDREAVRLLALFDVIDEQDGAFEFRDLVALRQVKRLLDGGSTIGDIIAASAAARPDAADGKWLARARLLPLRDGALGRSIGDYLAEIDGQMRLPLDDGGNPSLDQLFAAAAAAEDEERWGEAEATYRRLLALAPRDGVAHFNLANVLAAQSRRAEAEASLRRAVALEPGLAEAWYNLAHLLESRGDVIAARRCLERALDVDRNFADAVYNLARLRLKAGEPAAAAPLFERYLGLDPSSAWAARARQWLRLCHIMQRGAEDGR
jgi:tetratricopeptide (TPR) repeat protein